MIVQGSKLDFAVDLISKSSFRVELAELDWSFAPERHGVGFAKSDEERLFDFAISVEVLSEIARKVSV